MDRGSSRITTHLAVLHDSLLDENQVHPPLRLCYRIVVLVARSDGEFGTIGREGEGGDSGGVFGVQLHALLRGMVPD